MADIEKVIKALECCQIVYECKPYEKCPYSNGLECGDCDINRLHYDALELLKEKEAIQVKDIAEEIIGHKPKVKVGHCPCCGQLLNESSKYCNQCGQVVKWDDK